MNYAPFMTTSPAAIERGAATGLTLSQAEAFTDAADAAAVGEMRESLVGLFIRAMENAGAASTPKLPTVVSYNTAGENEVRDRMKHVVRLQPVTVVAHDLMGQFDLSDDLLRVMVATPEQLASKRAYAVIALAKEYAQSYASQLAQLGWSAAA